MTPQIILGVEGKPLRKTSGESNPGVNTKNDLKKGLYQVSWEESTQVQGFDLPSQNLTENIIKNSPKIVRPLEETPRSIASTHDSLYVLSRGGVVKIIKEGYNCRLDADSSNDSFMNAVKNDEPNIDSIQKGRVSFVAEHREMKSAMVIHQNNLLISMWLPNKQEWAKAFEKNPSLKKYGTSGYLFVAPGMDLTKISRVNKGKTSGGICYANNKVYTFSGLTINLFQEENSGYIFQNSFPHQADVLAMAALDENLLLTDIRGGYRLVTPTKDSTWPSSERLLITCAEKQEMALPTESIACTLGKYKNNTYAIMGLDDGKLRIYQLQDGQPKYKKTIRLISVDRIARETDKDDNVTCVKIVDDYVHVTLRNLYLRWDLETLLKFDDSKRINHQLDTETNNNYLKTMKQTYDLNSIIRVPHRITSFTLWGY